LHLSADVETERRGCLGSQDVFHVGTFNGVGGVCQSTFIDICSKVACARFYGRKNVPATTDLLND
jgi:hypothetical protein